MVRFYPFVRGLASYVLPKKLFTRPGSGGTFSAEYCYSVWLRHYTLLIKNGLINDVSQIKNIAEIGPGDSLGIGLAALFTGAEKYYAFDVIKHSNTEKNIAIAKELLGFFERNEAIPNTERQRFTAPILDEYGYPESLKQITRKAFLERYQQIENALKNIGKEVNGKLSIDYQVPWLGNTIGLKNEIDVIFSQAVMEHVEPIETAYENMFVYLKKGGIVSHQIDFKTHEMTNDWNGHWFISDFMWRILAHGRKYPMNRLPLSAHIKAMESVGFRIHRILPVLKDNPNKGKVPKVSNVSFTIEDFTISGALVQAIKP